MAKVKKYTVYQFAELSETAKEKAIEKMGDINISFDWWDSIYEDAARVGIQLKGFDIDRGSYCEGEFKAGALETADKVEKEHGSDCETFKTTKDFLEQRDNIVNEAPRDENGEFENEYALDQKLNEIESEYLKSILEDYWIILSKEYDHLTSSEAIKETIEANGYEFKEDGTLD